MNVKYEQDFISKLLLSLTVKVTQIIKMSYSDFLTITFMNSCVSLCLLLHFSVYFYISTFVIICLISCCICT